MDIFLSNSIPASSAFFLSSFSFSGGSLTLVWEGCLDGTFGVVLRETFGFGGTFSLGEAVALGETFVFRVGTGLAGVPMGGRTPEAKLKLIIVKVLKDKWLEN